MKNLIIVLFGCLLLSVNIFSCRDETSNPVSIDKIQFEVSKKDMYLGERATIKLTVSPKEARETKKVEYSASKQGIISINNEKSSNEGVVFEAVGAGSTVIMARVNGLVEYCDIKVEGDPEAAIPYISFTDYVIEMRLGTKRHVVASLQGGTQADQKNFTFSSKDDTVSVEYANNTVVIDGIKAGSARITAKHPKAQYSVDILVFVLNEGELAKYITGENVVFMQLGNGPRNYNVRLVGLQESEIGYCVYQVIEGMDVITVKGSGDSCTIEADKSGIAKVEVINQGVPYPFVFQVVICDSDEVNYISVPTNFMIIEGSGYYSIGASMVGEAPEDFPMRYEYKLSKNDIISVEQTRGSFALLGLKNGIVVMTISNKYSEFDAQILIVVQNLDGEQAENNKYIRTSQQVVWMENGKDLPDAILKMELVGGTSADQNDFEWVVEDSSVIEVHAPGKVSYTRAQTGKLSYEAEAIITAKRVGTTRINISNRKSLNDVTVIVKVYPKGTFNGRAVYLSGPSLIKVQEGKSVEIHTSIIGGGAQSLGNTNWSIPSGDSAIAQVNGSGLSGNITGKKSGVTKLKVTGENIAQDYDAVVVVYNEGQEKLVQYAYTDNLHYRITVGQTVKIPVYHPNITDNNFSFTVINSNKNSVYHVVSKDVIIVNGLSEGSGELVVTTSGGDCNNITLYITVEPAELAIDKPYMLTGGSFSGTNVGSVVSYTVTMAGANTGKLNGIVYSIDDERVARVKRSAANIAEIEGVAKGQTVLRINHGESMNEKAVVVYVVEEGQPVEGKIIIGIEKTNYVMSVNESLFLRLVTNATETQKLGFRWKTNNADKVYIEDNYDTAVITARESGSVKVTVYEKDNKHLIDLDIFITIKDENYINGQIGFPDSIILIKNENKAMRGNVAGSMPNSVNDISYTLENKGIAGITAQGLEVLLKGLEPGQTFLTVTSSRLNYYKKILVICVDNASDLDKLYYFTVDKMLYRIKKNDEVKINLVFGENGFPESEKALIEWSEKSNNQTVLITSPLGSGNTIVGKNEGQAVIQVKSKLMAKPVEIVVEVIEEVTGSDFYKFVYTPINQFTMNKVEMIPISIYYGNQYYSDYDIYKPGIKLEQGYSAIKVEVSDTSVAEAAMVGQSLRVSTKNPGKTIVTLSHEMISEDAKLMIVVYEEVVPPASSELVVFIPKTHWLITQGQAKEIPLQTNSSSSSGMNSIIWNNRNTNLFSVDASDKLNAVVTAIKEGSGTITIEYGGEIIDTIYISVSAGNISTVSAATESIIIMSMEDANFGPYRTKVIISGISSNVTIWNVANSSIIRIEPLGTYCDLYPVKAGMTELTVSGLGYSRTIIVNVVNTEAEKMSAKLMNLDQRYYKIKKGENIVLNPYYKAVRPSYPVSPTLIYDNKVIQCSLTNGGISVTGKNEGIERLKLYNEDCENKYFEVEFEVDEAVTGSFDEVKSLIYMTTEEPVVIIKPGETNYHVRIGVIGEYKGGEDDFKWTSNSNKVTVSSFGMYAFLTAGNQEGEAEITVSNQFCDGLPLKIKVILVKDVTLPNNGLPYLYTGKSVYTMQRGDPDLVIPLEIRGISPVYYNYVEIATKGNAVHTSFSNGNITVKEVNKGTSEIKVKYKGIDNELDLYIVVQDQFKTGFSYLTTGQNYVIVNKLSTVLVNVKLVNYTEPDSSNFSWYSEDPSVAYVVGNGQAVQILGMDVGITKVVVKHPVSYNNLDILVNVIPSGNSEDICYLTTGDNVIETYISASQGQIGINKVGGTTNIVNATWSVDNPTIVSILGNNDIGYYTPRKEGVTKITVTDKEAGSLSIVVIVRKRKQGELYLYTENAIVQVTPNSSNNTIKVELADGDESDEVNFKWEIYTQLPSSIDVARQGGSVVSIYAMGSRCSVNGIYAGTARLKITHPKAAEALFILVQVTNFKSMQFTQKNVDMEMDDMIFIALETPDYENYSGRVKYMSDNPSVCTVYGTSKAVLVSSYMAGRAVVTAYVEDTDLIAEVNINVLAEKDYEQPYIVTPKTTYVLNPRELPFIVEAQLYGYGVNDQDWDSLVWEVKNDSAGIIKIHPENANTANKSIGRSIQVVVQNKQYNGVESCIIEISCPQLTKRIKTIFVQVQEDSNAFTLNKYDITMQSSDMAELNCNILGGKTRDYDEVVWMAEMDGFDPTKEIVKIMGNGKNVHLLGMNDGVTQITAVYRGMIRVCHVKVKSSIFIGIQYQNFLTFPGERKKDKTLIEINYEVRPVNAFIRWMDTDTDFNNKIANVSYTTAKDDGTGTGRGIIMIDPIREGSFSIVGVSNQKNARVNIIVKNDFKFSLDRYEIDETPAGSTVNRRGQPKKKEDTTVNYIVSPANVIISPASHDYLELKELGITLDISPAERINEALKGIGTIYFRCEKEVNIELRLEILQTDGRPAGKDVIIKLMATFSPGEGRLIPVYEPVNGYLTGRNPGDKYPITSQIGKARGSPLTGSLYKSGAYLKSTNLSSVNSSGQFPNDEYVLEIGDGSTQYILLDRINPNAMIDIGSEITYTKTQSLGEGRRTDAMGNRISRDIVVKKEVRENGEMAIRIDGGGDFIVYSNYGTEFKLECTIDSPDPNAGYAYHKADGDRLTLAQIITYATSSQIMELTATRRRVRYFGVPFIDNAGNGYCEVSFTADSEGHFSSTPDYGSNFSGYYYYSNGVLTSKPVDLFTRQLTNEKSGCSVYSTAYKWQKIQATPTTWYPLTDTYGSGNIRLSIANENTTSSGYYESILFVPFILFEDYKKNFMRIYSNTVENGSSLLAYQEQDGNGSSKASELTIRNYIYGGRYIFERNANVFKDDYQSYTAYNPMKYVIGETKNSSNDPYYNYNNSLYSSSAPYFTISKGKYSRIGDRGEYDWYSVFRFARAEDSREYTPIGFSLDFLNDKVTSRAFYDQTSGTLLRVLVNELAIGFINIFKERYNSDTVICDPYAKSGSDKTITDTKTNPYRYFPLPNLLDYMGPRNLSYWVDAGFALLKNAGKIEISYKNIYGTNNKVTINLVHRVSPAYTGNKSVTVPPRIAMNWDETEEKALDEIFEGGNGVILDEEAFPKFNGKYRIPKGY